MTYSSGLIKPDGVERGLQADVFAWMEKVGLTVVIHKRLCLGADDVKLVYQYCFGMTHYQSLVNFMTSGPVEFYVVRSNDPDTVDKLNRLVGSTDPSKSSADTIRGKYGVSVVRNVIHSTQNTETFRSEINHFLTVDERATLT